METARRRFLEAGFAPEAVTITIQPRKIGVARDIIERATAAVPHWWPGITDSAPCRSS